MCQNKQPSSIPISTHFFNCMYKSETGNVSEFNAKSSFIWLFDGLFIRGFASVPQKTIQYTSRYTGCDTIQGRYISNMEPCGAI